MNNVSRLEVKWNDLTPVPAMEHDLKVLFARYGLEFTASGSDLIDYTRSLVFRAPLKEVRPEDFSIRATVRWTGLMQINFEGALERFLTSFGLKCTDRGRDADGDQERVLVFRQPE